MSVMRFSDNLLYVFHGNTNVVESADTGLA